MAECSKRATLLFIKRNFFCLCVLLLISINNIIVLSYSDDLCLKNGRDSYQKAEDLFLEFNLKNNQVLQLLEESVSYLSDMNEQQEKYYWMAKSYYLIGILEKDDNNHKKAEEFFTFGKESISKALEYGDFSDGLRLMADLEGQLIIYRDLYYKTKYGPPIRSMIVKAIELDPGNKNAYLSLAMYYRDAPLIAGGDLKKSKSTLKKMVENVSDDRLDLFSLYLWIETAWANNDNNLEKVTNYISMLNLFSNSTEIDLMAERIKSKYTGNK